MIKVFGSGRMTRDPEMKYSEKGTPYLVIGVASDDFDGEKFTVWISLTIFGKAAEFINNYGAKGSSVVYTGRIKVDSKTGNPRVYEAKDGAHKASLEAIVDTIELVGPAAKKEEAAQP